MNHINIIRLSLLELGCSDFEVQIYEYLCKQKSGITELAKHFDVHRKKIYLSLESLESLGIVLRSQNYSRQISIAPPNHILTLLKLKTSKTNKMAQELNTILPDLLSDFESKNHTNWVAFAKGENDFLNHYDSFIKEAKNDIVCFINPLIFNEVIDFSFVKHWSKNRQSKNLSIRILAPKEYEYLYKNDPDLESTKKFLREIRYIHNNYKFQGTVHISGPLVLLFDTIALKAVKIDNAIIANTLQTMFELEWNRVK
jgi:sugar-specific transcriptional regulator TrmB